MGFAILYIPDIYLYNIAFLEQVGFGSHVVCGCEIGPFVEISEPIAAWLFSAPMNLFTIACYFSNYFQPIIDVRHIDFEMCCENNLDFVSRNFVFA